MSEATTPVPKKTIEQRRKEVWTAGQMDPAILAYKKNHPEGIDLSVPTNTDIVYKAFYGKEIIDETPPPEVCAWCRKTKGEKETDCNCGRPTKYGDKIIKKAREYIDSCEDKVEEFHKTRGEKSDGYERILKANIPSIGGLADYLEVDRKVLYDWEAKYPMFLYVMERLRAKQEKVLINKGISGEYNPTIAKVLLTKHGYKDAVENDLTTGGKPIILWEK